MGWGLWFSPKIYFDQNLYIRFLEALAFKKNLTKSKCKKKKEKKKRIFKDFACCSGDLADKILREAAGAWRGDSEWGRVFWKNRIRVLQVSMSKSSHKRRQSSSLNCEPTLTSKHTTMLEKHVVLPLSIYQVLWNPPLPAVGLSKNSGSHFRELSDGPPVRVHQRVRQANSLADNK